MGRGGRGSQYAALRALNYAIPEGWEVDVRNFSEKLQIQIERQKNIK